MGSCRLRPNPSSRGRHKGYALAPPLMSNVRPHRMQFVSLVRTASPTANVLAALALTLLLLKLVVLNRVPATVPVFYDLGMLVEAVLSSVVASYAFYLVVVHVKEVSDRSTVRPYILKHSQRVVAACRQQIMAVSTTSGVPLAFESVTREQLTEAFTKLAPYGEAPMIIFPNNTANWLQYLEYFMRSTKQSIGRVLAQLPFLEARLVAQLASVDDCSHFEHLSLMGSSVPVRNADLSAWAPSFYKYVELCRALSSTLGAPGPEDAA